MSTQGGIRKFAAIAGLVLAISLSLVTSSAAWAKGAGSGGGGGTPALYTAHGFVQAADGTLVFSSSAYRVTIGGAATDHSATRTTVVVWLQTL